MRLTEGPILGLDVSTKLGACVLPIEGDQPDLLAQYETDLVGFERVIWLRNVVRNIMETYTPEALIIEGYGFGNRFTLSKMVECGTVVREHAFDLGIPWIDVPPSRLKKWTTGSGKATKVQMMKSVVARWGVECKTDDAADAYALAQFGRHSLMKLGN